MLAILQYEHHITETRAIDVGGQVEQGVCAGWKVGWGEKGRYK